MRFPVIIRHRGEKAKVYGKSPGYDFYRIAYRTAGKRCVRSFKTYAEAKTEAERVVRDLAQGSQAAGLSPAQSRDAVAAFQRLDAFRQSTGKRYSLLGAVSELLDVCGKLNGRSVAEAVDGFLGSVATVKREDIAKAVEDFIQADEPRTRAANGERAQLSAKYADNRAIILRRFSASLPGHAVCDLAKAHLDAFMGSLGEFSAKSRNHHRAAIRQWLQWAVRKDFLPVTHRLNEADGLRPEHANNGQVEFYTPAEIRALLETAEGPMRAMVAIGGLAGLRSAELLRLTWEDVWRVPGHIEVTAGKSKTRSRRLVEVCPALAAWLEDFRAFTSGKVCPIEAKSAEVLWQQQFLGLCDAAKVNRKANGLRHAFCSYHFAANSNENLTAAQAGNSPAMIHQHYKGLATKAEAEKWFGVKPSGVASNVVQLAATAVVP